MNVSGSATASRADSSTFTLRFGNWLSGRSIVIAVALLGSAVIAILLVETGILSVHDGPKGGLTLGNFTGLFSDRFAYHSLLNTFGFAGIAVAVSVFFGLPIAWLAERTDLPKRGLIFPMMTAGILMPGFFNAMGWLFLLHPRIGMFNVWLMRLFHLSAPPINIGSVVGMGVVQGLGLASLMFIMCAPSIRAINGSLEEAGQIHGLGLGSRLARVVLPLIWPAIIAAAIYVFMVALAAFDVPAVIGLANRTYMYSTFVNDLISPTGGLPNYGLAAASSVAMVLIALVLSAFYFRVVRRAHRFAVVTGKGYRPTPIALGRWKWAGWAFVLLHNILSVLLPALALIWSSLLPVFEPFSIDAFSRVSLVNFTSIAWDGFWLAAENSLIVMAVAPALAIAVSLAIAWVIVRSGWRLAPVFDAVAFVPLAIPSIVFAVGAMGIALFWLPPWIPFYGRLSIVITVQMVVQVSFATRVLSTSLVQVHRELDEAGYVFGLGSLGVLWSILRPLLAPAILYTWIWLALLAYRELTIPAVLAAGGTMTLPVFVYGMMSGGLLGQAAALTLIVVALMTPFVFAYFLLIRRGFSIGV